MENRFGVKDFILVSLLTAVIVLIIVAMFQYDRQWDRMASIKDRLDDQAKALHEIRESLAGGITVAGGPVTRPAFDPKTDPFADIRAATTRPGFSRGDWLIEMFPGQVAKLTPLLSGDVYASTVQDYILETLCQRNSDTLEWTGLIAKDWQIIDKSADYEAWVATQKQAGQTDEQIAKDPAAPEAVRIRFTLRESVRFSDGEPLTADDVIFTFNFIMNDKIAAPRQRAYFERIKRIEKLGPLQVEFVFGEPYFEAFDLAASLQVMPQHFYGAMKPEDFNQSVGFLMGSGAYRVENPTTWKPGEQIQLIRNDRYWGLAPAFDRLLFKEISNDKARLAMFRNGEVDIFSATSEQYRELIQDASLMSKVQRFEYQSAVGGYRYVAWNQKNPLFADKRVRRALTMLLDRERMIQEIAHGYAVGATGPFNPQSKQYNPDVKPWSYDVEAAKKLLAEAGFKPGSDGLIRSPDGTPFEFKLTFPSGASIYAQQALFMKDAYARAGIVLKPDPLEWGAFTQRLEEKNFEAISLGWSAGIETDIYQMFHSSQSKPGGDNFMSYKNQELDAAISQARRTMNEARRMQLWRKAHVYLHEDQPYTFLWFGKNLVFVDQRIENIQRVKLGLNPRVEWFVPAGKQKWTK